MKSQVGKNLKLCCSEPKSQWQKEIGFGIRQICAIILVQPSTRRKTSCSVADNYFWGSISCYKIVVMAPTIRNFWDLGLRNINYTFWYMWWIVTTIFVIISSTYPMDIENKITPHYKKIRSSNASFRQLYYCPKEWFQPGFQSEKTYKGNHRSASLQLTLSSNVIRA